MMTMLTPDDYCWRRGYPPDMDASKWEVCWTVGGVVWHRRKRAAPTNGVSEDGK